jgi:hypothetical protein
MPGGYGGMSRPKGSNQIQFARKVVKTWLLYSQGYSVERIAYDLKVSQRMIYYYLKAWRINQAYFVKMAKDAGALSLYDEAMIPTDQPGVYKFKPW